MSGTPRPELKRIARELLFRSRSIENSSRLAPAWMGALGQLAALEPFVRESISGLIPTLEPALAAPTRTAPQPSSPHSSSLHSSSPQPSYESARTEYRPALGDPELVQALLALQSQSRRQPLSSRSRVIRPEEARSSQSSPGFLSQKLQEVVATPKTPARVPRAPGHTRSILRSGSS